jgi:hypothetical protein
MDAALVTGATAIFTGLLGYLGARLQYRGEESRIQVERDRLRLDQTRAQADQTAVAAQHLEQQLERRQRLYYDFLDSAEKAWSLSVRTDPLTGADLDKWWVGYQRARRQLLIGSAKAVVTASYQVNDALVEVYKGLASAVPETDAEQQENARLEVWRNHGTEVDSKIQDLQQAMRTDLDVQD